MTALARRSSRTRVAIYARVSTSTQVVTGTSLRDQVKRLKAYARSNGMDVVDVYSDAGLSGAAQRPQFDRIRADAALGLFDVILATSGDRLSRRLSGWPALYDEVAPYGVDLVTIDDGVDSRGAGGAIIGSIRSAIAADERNRIRQRCLGGKIAAVQEGRWVNSTPPFGYRRVRAADRRGWVLEPDPREREVVRLIYRQLVDRGESAGTVADALAGRGWTQRSGLTWTARSLGLWAHRPLTVEAAGGRTRTSGVWQQWEPLLPAHHVQRWRDWRESRYVPQNARGPYLLAGMVVMPCGRGGLGRTAASRQATYSCREHLAAARGGERHVDCLNVSVAWLDQAVRDQVRAVLAGQLEEVVAAQSMAPPADDLDAAQRLVAELDQRIGDTLAALLDEGIPPAAATRAVADMRRDREDAATKVAQLHRDAYTAQAAPKLARAVLGHARRALAGDDPATWRAILLALSAQVTVLGHQVCSACGGSGVTPGPPLRPGQRGWGQGYLSPPTVPCPTCMRMRRIPVVDIAIDQPLALAVQQALTA